MGWIPFSFRNPITNGITIRTMNARPNYNPTAVERMVAENDSVYINDIAEKLYEDMVKHMYRIILLTIGDVWTYCVRKDMPIKDVSRLVIARTTLLLILGINKPIYK